MAARQLAAQQAAQQSQQHVFANGNVFNLLGIAFRFNKHPYPYYSYLSGLFNALYCTIPIEKNQLVSAGIFLDNGLTTIPVDIMDRI